MRVLSLLLGICGLAAAAEVKDWKSIGAVSGIDPIAQIHITNLLLSHEIESAMEGSLMYGVLVPPENAEKAVELLRTDALKLRYRVRLGNNEVVEPVELKVVLRGISVSSALKNPEFGSETALGRFLRSEQIEQLTAKYPDIISLSVRKRQYLATPKRYETGYDVDIRLRNLVQGRAQGSYYGFFRVYDGGRQVFGR